MLRAVKMPSAQQIVAEIEGFGLTAEQKQELAGLLCPKKVLVVWVLLVEGVVCCVRSGKVDYPCVVADVSEQKEFGTPPAVLQKRKRRLEKAGKSCKIVMLSKWLE